MSTALVIRPATHGDVPAITEIYNHAVLHTTASYDLEPVTLAARRAWFDEKATGRWPVWVAQHGAGAVIAWATFGPFRAKPGYRFTAEHSVYVAPRAQGAGVGHALMTMLIASARQRGLHSLVGAVDADNAGSLAFHARLGFVPVAHFQQVGHKFGRWLDLVFVQLLLEEAGEG
ncbi:GNAT family N-acetyltransferase [Deinococcus arcticus]|uniref:GNAT family N-acetyltransferase n=1 Tax=Deinococcus arcticus TaxID=2136176 RepID=A0A2T3WD77_9DEIO|nr:GNAT family N-acetyltransferase [Deinococcus arcticus]PTA69754.1 GNAT family N-acetyltransferase [Deinococcus arcticus]